MFKKRFDDIIAKKPIPESKHLWSRSFLFSLGIFLLIHAYVVWTRQTEFLAIRTFNATTAWAGVLFIGLSMVLSAVTFFWDFADRMILYRKHIGVLGFFYVLIHGLISLFALPGHGLAYYLAPTNIVAFLLGLFSLIYFGFMAAISNKYLVQEIGGQRWRFLLRMGYGALFLGLLHFSMQSWRWWMKWIDDGLPWPPSIGIILFIFTILVFYMRIVLEIDLRMQKRSKAATIPTSATNTPIEQSAELK